MTRAAASSQPFYRLIQAAFAAQQQKPAALKAEHLVPAAYGNLLLCVTAEDSVVRLADGY